MSAKRGRAKVLKGPPKEKQTQKASDEHSDSPNLSDIDKASFLAGLQDKYGAPPLHSTAMEEDLNDSEGQMDKGEAGRRDTPKKTTGKKRGAAATRKETEGGEEGEKEQGGKKKKKGNTGEKVKTRRENGATEEKAESEVEKAVSEPSSIPKKSSQPAPAASRPLVGKKPAKRRSVRPVSAARPGKNQQLKEDKKMQSDSGSGKSTEGWSQDEPDSDSDRQRHRRVLSSDEDMVKDADWKPSPKRARMSSLGKRRKSTSAEGSASGGGGQGRGRVDADKQRRKRRGGHGRTELDVVLHAFLDFCDKNRDSGESEAVQQSIDTFTNNVKDQLLEKISSSKKLRVLKRDNAKVASQIRTKRQRLLDAKHELMKAERQKKLLQEEKAQLKLRLADLRQGQAFLRDIRELNRQYLDYRHKHPNQKETYGASSLPALLLETRLKAAELQQKATNNRLEKKRKKKQTQK